MLSVDIDSRCSVDPTTDQHCYTVTILEESFMTILKFTLEYLPSIVSVIATVYVVYKNHKITKPLKKYLA